MSCCVAESRQCDDRSHSPAIRARRIHEILNTPAHMPPVSLAEDNLLVNKNQLPLTGHCRMYAPAWLHWADAPIKMGGAADVDRTCRTYICLCPLHAAT